MNTRFTIFDNATPALQQMLARSGQLKPLHEAAGKGVEVALKGHFKNRQAEGNKRGWPDRYFWSGRQGVAQKTRLTSATNARAVVTIADPRFTMKVNGGTITPKRGKFLALAENEEAYAKSGQGRIRDVFPQLKIAIDQKLGLVLVDSARTKIKIGRPKKDGSRAVANAGNVSGGEIFFNLAKRSHQKPDPNAMPAEGVLPTAASQAVNDFIQRNVPGGAS